MESNLKKNNVKWYVILHILLLFLSFTGVLSKLASREHFPSLTEIPSKLAAGEMPFSGKFILLYGGILFILAVYAIAWQQILKYIPLTTAFCNKAVNIIWGIVWGALIFKEQIKINMFIGAVIVIVGVIIVVTSDE